MSLKRENITYMDANFCIAANFCNKSSINKLINIKRAILITTLLTSVLIEKLVKYVRYVPISSQSSPIKSRRIYISFQRLHGAYFYDCRRVHKMRNQC